MAIYFGHTTALKLLLVHQLVGKELDSVRLSHLERRTKFDERVLKSYFEDLGLPLELFLPLDIVVPTGACRKSTKMFRPRLFSAEVPVHAFYQLTDELHVATPEFCFLQMASELDELELLKLGMSLCGGYWPARTTRGFVDHEPLTSQESLVDFLEQHPRQRGRFYSQRVAKHVLNNAASPMETACGLLLSLPRQLGGFGLPRPVLNCPVILSPRAASIAGQSRCKLDLCWPEYRFALEYQGRDYHRSERRDATRALALEMMGYELRFIYSEQLKIPEQTEEVVLRVARRLRRSARPSPPDTEQRRFALRRALLGRNDSAWGFTPQEAELFE